MMRIFDYIGFCILCLHFLPSRIRGFCASFLFKQCGSIKIEQNVKIRGFNNIEIGNNVTIQKNTHIDARGGYIYLADWFNAFPETTIIAQYGKLITGTHFSTARNVDIYCSCGEISTGKNFSLNQRSLLHAGNSKIVIGDDCLFGYDVKLFAGIHDHGTSDKLLCDAGMRYIPISIGNDVWIASNVIVNAGVTVGSHTVVGAGSIVTKNIPDYSFCAGAPAKIIKSRKTNVIQ